MALSFFFFTEGTAMKLTPLNRLFSSLDIEIHNFVKYNQNIDNDSYHFLDKKIKEISCTVLSKEEKLEAYAWVGARLQEVRHAYAIKKTPIEHLIGFFNALKRK